MSAFQEIDDELIFLPAVPDRDPELAQNDAIFPDPTPDALIRVRKFDHDGKEIGGEPHQPGKQPDAIDAGAGGENAAAEAGMGGEKVAVESVEIIEESPVKKAKFEA